MEDCKKNFLLFIPTLEIGGAEKQAILFAKFLKQKNCSVVVSALQSRGAVLDILKKENIDFFQIRDVNSLISLLLHIFVYLQNRLLKKDLSFGIVKTAWSIARLISKEKFDYAISYCAVCNTFLGNSKRFYKGKCRFIWFQRDAGIQNMHEPSQLYAVNKMDMFLANSISGKMFLKQKYNKDSTVIYNGLKLAAPKKTKPEWYQDLSLTEDVCIVTMIANLSKAKKHLLLLKAWLLLKQENRLVNAKLLLAGRFDDMYEELKSFVLKNSLSDSVLFLGPVTDVAGLLSITDIFVFPAISEGTSNSIIEAELSGLPVVATNLPEIKDIVSEENYDYLLDNSEDIFAKKIYELINDETKVKFIGIKNKYFAENKFSETVNFTLLYNEIRKIQNRNKNFQTCSWE